jgi:hypothetical protein
MSQNIDQILNELKSALKTGSPAGAGITDSASRQQIAINDNGVVLTKLRLDRVLGDTLRGNKALILVDIEGAEFMMLQGANQTLINEPRPIWLMEIASTEHQPAGVATNPYFAKTFELFFAQGYRSLENTIKENSNWSLIQ